MVDQPGQAAKGSNPETIFNSGIGDDWGEAFEAEDFMASPNDEANAEFFLPDEIFAATISSAPISSAVGATAPAVSSPELPSKRKKSPLARLLALPLPFRLVAVAIPVLALALFLILRGKAPEEIAPSVPPAGEAVVVSQPEAETPVTLPLEPEPVAKLEEPSAVPLAEQSKEAPAPVALEAKELRKKWHFPALIIHAKTNKDQGTVILSIDLTLVLRLAPDVMLPYDKDSFVREILYQFYINQPVADLQRYALERGELNRKMQDWILKQWPELQLDSVATERYQLL